MANPFDFDGTTGSSVIGGGAADQGMGMSAGLRLPTGGAGNEKALAQSQQILSQAQQAYAQPAAQPTSPLVGYNPATGQVASGAGVFSLDNLTEADNAIKKGALNTPLRQLPPGFIEATPDDIVNRMNAIAQNRGFFSAAKETGKAAAVGLGFDVPDMVLGAARAPATPGGDFDQWAAGAQKYIKNSAPTLDTYGRGDTANAFISAGRSAAPSMIAMGATAINPVLGAGVATGLFGGSQFTETYDKAISKGLPPGDAFEAALKTGAIEGLGEAAADVAGAKLLSGATPILRNLINGGKLTTEQAVKIVTDPGMLRKFATDMGANAMVQPGTEYGQNYGETAVENSYGISNENPHQQGMEGFKSGLAMSALFAPLGIPGHRAAAQQRAALGEAIADPSKSVNLLDAGRIVQQEITPLVGREAAGAWRNDLNNQYLQSVQQNEPAGQADMFGVPRQLQSQLPQGPQGLQGDLFGQHAMVDHSQPPAPPVGGTQGDLFGGQGPQQGTFDFNAFTDRYPQQIETNRQQAHQEVAPGVMFDPNTGTYYQTAPQQMGRPANRQQPMDQGPMQQVGLGADPLNGMQQVETNPALMPQQVAPGITGLPGSGIFNIAPQPQQQAPRQAAQPAAPQPMFQVGQNAPGNYTDLFGNLQQPQAPAPQQAPAFELQQQDGTQGNLDLQGGSGTGLTDVPVHYGKEKRQKAQKQDEMQLHPDGVNGAKSKALYDRAARVMNEDQLAQVVSQLQQRQYKGAEKDIIAAEKSRAQTSAPAQATVVAQEPAPAAKPATKSEQLKQRAKAKKETPNARPDQEHANAPGSQAAPAVNEQERASQADEQKQGGERTGSEAKPAEEKVAKAEKTNEDLTHSNEPEYRPTTTRLKDVVENHHDEDIREEAKDHLDAIREANRSRSTSQKQNAEEAAQNFLKNVANYKADEHGRHYNIDEAADAGWHAVHDAVRESKTLGEALKHMLSLPNVSSWQKLLINALLQSKSVREAGFTLNPESVESAKYPGMYALGHYDDAKNHVYLHGGGGTMSLLHEAVHAAVLNKMEADGAFMKAMSNLYLQAKKALPKGHYGMTDVHEFVAEAFANPEFQKALDGIPSKQQNKASPSLWRAFVDLIRSGLRLFSVQRSLLDDVISLAGPHIPDDNGPGGGKKDSTIHERAVSINKAKETLGEKAQQVAGTINGSTAFSKILEWSTLRQIKDKYAHMLHGAKEFIEATFNRASLTTERINKLTPLAERMDNYRRKSNDLENLLLAGDELEVDIRPGEHRKDALKRYAAPAGSVQTEEDKAKMRKVEELVKQYDEKMSDEGKKLYGEIRDFFDQQAADTHAAMVNMVTSLIRDPKVRAARLADLNKWYATRVAGYFPHMRYGDHIVSYKDKTTGDKVVEMYESEWEATKAFEEAKAEGQRDVTKRRKTNVANSGFDLINDLNSAVDSLQLGDSADVIKQQMRDALQEVYIKALPEYSGAKFRLRRSNVKGYSKDVVRAMASQGSRMARHISRMEMMPTMNAAMSAMSDAKAGKAHAYVLTAEKDGKVISKVFADRMELQSWLDNEGKEKKSAEHGGQRVYQDVSFSRVETIEDASSHFAGAGIEEADRPMDAVQAQLDKNERSIGDSSKLDALYNHFKKINELDGKDASGFVNAFTQTAWAYHLGLTPSFAFINLLQTPAMHTPWLASRRGIGLGKAFKHTMAAYGKIIKNIGDLGKATWKEDVLSAMEGKVTSDEMAMLREMMRRNLIDFTTSYDLMAMAKGSSEMSDLKRKAMKVSSYMAQYSEVVNRLVTALSTYNAAIDAKYDEKAARDMVEKALAETQGDYSPENTPYAMDRRKAGYLAMMFQFQKYRQFTLYGLLDNTKKAFAGDKEARDLVLGWCVSHAALFGTVGMPIALPVLWILAAATKDDDEPVDIQLMLKKFYTGITGSEKMAEVMTHGALRTIGISVTGRAGMGDILPGTRALMDPKQTSEKDAQSAWATAFADAFAGAAGGVVNNMFNAAGFFADGQFERGVEAMAPKAVKDVMAAIRYHTEGVTTRDGQNKLMEEVSLEQSIVKALGFTPAEIANLYEKRGSLQAIEQFINNGKTRVKHEFVRASMGDDPAAVDKAIERWQSWNEKQRGRAGTIPYGELLQARNQVMKKERELLQSGGLYATKQGRKVAGEYGLE